MICPVDRRASLRARVSVWQPRILLILGMFVVFVVVDSHIQRIVVAPQETTLTQQVSHRPVKCQSRLSTGHVMVTTRYSDQHKEVRRSTGHIMVTTRYSDQQRLYKQWHRPISKRFIKPPYSISRATSIDSECCRLPTTSVLRALTNAFYFSDF